jgi:hypothetical protein
VSTCPLSSGWVALQTQHGMREHSKPTIMSRAAKARMSSERAQLPAQMRLVCFAATGIFLRSLTKYSCRLPLTVPTASTELHLDHASMVTS